MEATHASLRRETAWCVLGLAVLAVAVLGWYVAHGGFYWDDWENAATTSVASGGDGFLGPVNTRLAAYEPGLALLIPATHGLFGPRPELHLALATILALAASGCFFVVLRTLGVRNPHAGAIAALAFMFPWSDSNRLWATGGLNNVALLLFLAGLALALRELKTASRRPRIVSLGLYVASVLTYDVAGVAVLAAGLLYLAAAPRARALKRWRQDILVVGPAVVLATVASTKHKYGAAESLSHAAKVGRQAAELVGRAAVPIAKPSAAATVAVAAGVLLVALAVFRLLREESPLRRSLRGWLWTSAGATGGMVAAYAVFVPADPKYVPFADGLYNRVNLVAGFMIAALVYAVAAIVATLACGAPALRRGATPLALALALAIGTGWAVRVHEDGRLWARAAAWQGRVLAALRTAATPDARGERIFFYTFGAPLRVSAGVPVFASSWDLDYAAKLALHDPTVAAAPVAAGYGVRCGPLQARTVSPAGYTRAPASYGRLVFVDVRSGRQARIRDRAGCTRAAAKFSARS